MSELSPPAQALWSRLRDSFGFTLTQQLERSLTHAPAQLAEVVRGHGDLYAQVGRTFGLHWTHLASWRKTRDESFDLLERFVALAPASGMSRQEALDHLLQGAVVLIQDHALPLVHWLLAKGANPNTPNPLNEDRTALGQVVTRPHTSAVLDALLAAGAAPDRRNRLGRTPLQETVLGGHLPHALSLVRAGATLDRPDPVSHRTPRQLIQARWHDTAEGAFFDLAEQARIVPHQTRPRRRF